MRASRPTMRAWCQHCDATEVIKPEEIYSPEFNFWCPRCQSILILQDDTGGFSLSAEPQAASYDPVTKHDREDDEAAVRQAQTKEDDDLPPPVDVTYAEPDEPAVEREVARDRKRTVSLDTLDAYSALAAELDAGIAEDERSRPTRRHGDAPSISGVRERPTEREPKRELKRSGVLPRTRADSEEVGPANGGPANGGATNGHVKANGHEKTETTVRELADLARHLDQPGPSSTASRSMKRPVPGPEPRPAKISGSLGVAGGPFASPEKTPADSGPIMARETVRVNRPSIKDAVARREVEQRLGKTIAPALPPLPNWDGGDTQQVRELARSAPPRRDEDTQDDLPPSAEDAEPVDDALEKLAVVEPKDGTTGMGSRTYERVDDPIEDDAGDSRDTDEDGEDAGAAVDAQAGAPTPARGSPSEDLDWYALLDEALPEADGADAGSDDASRVVIRLPETMAPTSEADAEQVRQLQAKLEARGLHGVAETTASDHHAKKLDSKKLRDVAGGDDDDTDDVGHTAVKEDETKDFVPGSSGKKDEDETRDNPGRAGSGRPSKVDPDAPTTSGDPEKTAQLRADVEAAEAAKAEGIRAEARLSDSRRVTRTETGRKSSERRTRPGSASGIVVEQFNRSDLDPGLVCARDSSSPEADYFKQLYQRIFHSRNGASPRVVLVTSASKGEGKTTVAANLALVAARMPGRGALLIEADPRGGDLLRSFGLRMKAEGLLEALESGKDPSGFILQFKLGMLDVLPLGVPGSDAAELISSDRVGEVIRGLSQRYPSSVVIIDGSSVLHAPDPLVLARHVDGVVLVVRADVTPREQVERARDLIGAEKVLGVVLNQAGS